MRCTPIRVRCTPIRVRCTPTAVELECCCTAKVAESPTRAASLHNLESRRLKLATEPARLSLVRDLRMRRQQTVNPRHPSGRSCLFGTITSSAALVCLGREAASLSASRPHRCRPGRPAAHHNRRDPVHGRWCDLQPTGNDDQGQEIDPGCFDAYSDVGSSRKQEAASLLGVEAGARLERDRVCHYPGHTRHLVPRSGNGRFYSVVSY